LLDRPTLATDEAASAALRGAWLTVDLGAIAANVQALRAWLPTHTRLMAVVKADAYGHGALQVARTAIAAGADWLGVATVAEGLKLRALGINHPMLLLGLLVPDAYETALAAGLDVTLSGPEDLRRLSAIAARMGRMARVHLKLDTGMTRVGAPVAEAKTLVDLALGLLHVELVGVTSHLATSESADPTYADLQIRRFFQAVDELVLPHGVLCHVANSGGTLLHPESHADMVRVGLMLYGLPPREGVTLPFPLCRALSAQARITQLRSVEAGIPVGYGGRFVTERPTQLALLPVGYADGMPRALSNRQDVLIKGVRCPIVGAVSMDQCTVDVTGVEAWVGDEAVLLGRQGDREIEVEEWAKAADTIPYEIICGLGRRLPKVYLPA
jgi:alanine racemase